MKKTFLLKRMLLFVGVMLVAAGSQAQSASLLWKVTSQGSTKPTYIFGTIHSIPQSQFFFPEAINEALKSSDKLVLEIDMDSTEELATLPSLIVLKGKTMKDLLTAEEVKKLSRYLSDSAGIPFEQVTAFKPFVFTSLLLPKIVGSSTVSYEQHLLAAAKQMGKPVDGIETVAEQVGAFDKLPMEQQAKQLVEMVSDMNKAREEYQQLLNAYTNQQLNKIAELTEKSNKDFPQFSQVLITDRNVSWIPRLEKIIGNGGAFVAVGAAHLPGSNGVVELLKKKGYSVEPITIK